MACPVPPKFNDIGKNAKDLLNKNFTLGAVKVEGKSRSPANGVAFTVNTNHATDSGKVASGLEMKMESKEKPGLSLMAKWNTDNIITINPCVANHLVKGAKTEIDFKFSPDTGKKSAKVMSSYARPNVNTTLDIDVNPAGPVVHGSAVLGHCRFLLGAAASIDTGKSALTKNALALAYCSEDISLHASLSNMVDAAFGLHHKVSPTLNVGGSVAWSKNKGAAPLVQAGAQVHLDRNTFLKAKIDSALRCGLSYVTKVQDGVQLTMSMLVNAKSLDSGNHKVGLSLDLSA